MSLRRNPKRNVKIKIKIIIITVIFQGTFHNIALLVHCFQVKLKFGCWFSWRAETRGHRKRFYTTTSTNPEHTLW